MKNTHKLLILIGLISTLTACSNPLLRDPRLYNKKPDTNTHVTPPQKPNFDIGGDELPGLKSPFDEDTWFNKQNCNGDANSPDKLDFNATDFEQLAITSWFDTNNVPHYDLFLQNPQEAKWVKVSEPDYNKFSTDKAQVSRSKANSMTKGGFPVNDAYYHTYRGKNPLYDLGTNEFLATTKNGNPKLNRFYFYRFTGVCAGNNLDPYLIAIDTYSKYVFSFAKPAGFDKIFTGDLVPTGWLSVDEDRPFYEYDPIGYVVKENDKYIIHIYDWFTTNISSKTNPDYSGKINKYEKEEIALKNPNGAGKSPFARAKAKGFSNNVMGKTYSYRDENGCGLNKIEYTFSNDGKSLTITTTPWKGISYKETVAINDTQDGKLTATATVSGNNIILVLNEDNSLSINGQIAFINFKDLGPSFLKRVKGKTYEGSGYTYVFSDDGRTINYSGKRSGQYNYNETEHPGTHGIYDGYGITLYDSDREIRWTNGLESSKNEGTKNSAWIKTNNFSDLLSNFNGKTFYYRPEDKANGYKNGEILYIYNFSNSGKTIKVKTENYTTKEIVEDVETYVFDKGINNNTGIFKDKSDNEVKLSLSSDYKTITLSAKQYSDTDPGPDFLIRVKGKTFTGSGYTYTFNDTGTIITYSGKREGTYSYDQSFSSSKAAYKDNNPGFWNKGLPYWGIEISKNDEQISWTGSGWASGNDIRDIQTGSTPADIVKQ